MEYVRYSTDEGYEESILDARNAAAERSDDDDEREAMRTGANVGMKIGNTGHRISVSLSGTMVTDRDGGKLWIERADEVELIKALERLTKRGRDKRRPLDP